MKENDPELNRFTEEQKKLLEWATTPEADEEFKKAAEEEEAFARKLLDSQKFDYKELQEPYGARQKRVFSSSFLGI